MNPDDYETLPTDNVGTHMIAGAIAGIMEHCVMYPLDSVKVSKHLILNSLFFGTLTQIYHINIFLG